MSEGEAKINVIDIFAGPGGLGEGFCGFKQENKRPFKIAISIEKEKFAHSTLELRAFYRSFKEAPIEYYQYLWGEISKEALYEKFKDNAEIAKNEAWLAELGENGIEHSIVVDRIKKRLKHGMPTVLIGGPPCQAYSLAGRVRMQSNEKFYSDQRHVLYKEYLRIIHEFLPEAFVMENVKGILSSKLNGEPIFPKIMSDLGNPSLAIQGIDGVRYKIFSLTSQEVSNKGSDYIIKSELYGIPQARHRVILLGIREDICIAPSILKKAKKTVTVKDAIKDLPMLRSGLSKGEDTIDAWESAIKQFDKNYYVTRNLERGGEFVPYNYSKDAIGAIRDWLFDPRLKGAVNHHTRTHIISDLWRYYFLAQYSAKHKTSPKLYDMPESLLPNHKNVDLAIKGRNLFSDRFRVQLCDKPSSTITSHISKDGHYFIHYDNYQCRSLTVREAARIQTFPDNYKFEGPRTAQYQQVGNAVPPYLAMQIANIVYGLLKDRCA